MADSRHITRRALIKAAPALALIAAAPVAASEEATPPFDLQGWLDNAEPLTKANYHLSELTKALCDHNPGQWVSSCQPGFDDIRQHEYVLINRSTDADAKHGVWVQFL